MLLYFSECPFIRSFTVLTVAMIVASAVTSVEVDQVPCTLLSLNFFDRLKNSGRYSNMDTIGTEESVFIREVSFYQGLNCTWGKKG